MTFFLRIELNEENTLPLDDEKNDFETSPPIEQAQPIVIEIVEKVTLGRGDDTSDNIGNTTKEIDPNSEQAFNRQMDLLSNPHIDLSPFYAHHRGVSRKHARITLHNMRLSVLDLGSTNGTYVNNERIDMSVEFPLKEGDDLRLGFLSLRVTLI